MCMVACHRATEILTLALHTRLRFTRIYILPGAKYLDNMPFLHVRHGARPIRSTTYVLIYAVCSRACVRNKISYIYYSFHFNALQPPNEPTEKNGRCRHFRRYARCVRRSADMVRATTDAPSSVQKFTMSGCVISEKINQNTRAHKSYF